MSHTMPYLDRIEFTIRYFEWRHDYLDGITIAFRNVVKTYNGKCLTCMKVLWITKLGTSHHPSGFQIKFSISLHFYTKIEQKFHLFFTFVKEHLTKVIHFFESICIEFNSFLLYNIDHNWFMCMDKTNYLIWLAQQIHIADIYLPKSKWKFHSWNICVKPNNIKINLTHFIMCITQFSSI